jgi:SOUL heme-binding protein
MRGKSFSRLSTLGLVVVSLFLFPPQLLALEELPYQVLKKAGDFEIRRYPSYLAAQTLVEGGFQRVGNEGFRRLVAYTQGQNRQHQAIPMVAPVNQEDVSAKISMNAPVSQEKAGDKWMISFIMPSSYTREALPAPLDSRIRLVGVPPTLMAAVRYSGLWNLSLYQAEENRLREFIRRQGLKIIGAPIFARYNSPFMLWFLRRNEVLIPVARGQ